jgi:hypothetical protein
MMLSVMMQVVAIVCVLVRMRVAMQMHIGRRLGVIESRRATDSRHQVVRAMVNAVTATVAATANEHHDDNHYATKEQRHAAANGTVDDDR